MMLRWNRAGGWTERRPAVPVPGQRGGRGRRAQRRRAARLAARGRVRHAARRLLRADDPGRRARLPRGGARRAAALRPEGVPERRRCCDCSRPRASAPTSRRSASSRSRAEPGSRASGSSSTGTTSPTTSCGPRPRRGALRRARRARRGGARGAAGVRRALVRVTPGIDADTHEAIRTAHHGSKFGLPPDDALEAVAEAQSRARGRGRAPAHRLAAARPPRRPRAIDWLGTSRACRDELGWTRGVDLGGGLGVPTSKAAPARDPRVRRRAAGAARGRLAPAGEPPQ